MAPETVKYLFAAPAGILVSWLVTRHVVLASVRGRRIILTSRSSASLIAGLAVVAATVGDSPTVALVSLALGVSGATAITLSRVWVAFGLTVETLLDQAEFIARGLRLDYQRSSGSVRSVTAGAGVTVAAAMGRTLLIRLTHGSKSEKSLLFSRALVKFLGPKEQGGGR